MFIDLNKIDLQILAKLIRELEEKGFYSNGQIVCGEEQGKEVRDILDKYLLNE